MEILILKSAACLAILMVFYKLFLEYLAIHKFKRFYLLGALIVSIVIPFITFTEYVEPVYDFENFNTSNFETSTQIPSQIIETQPEQTSYLPLILWSLYGLGVLLFLSKFCINLFSIISKINKNEKRKHSNFISVLLNDLIVPHTFFSYIFLNKTKFEAKAIPKEVLLHEQTHASQKHSLDVLFIELLQIVFWFNPLLYFIKKDIKLNHEFLADEAVLKQGIDSSTYQETLLQFTSTANEIPLAHAINYSLIKKRFTLMKTKTSKKAIWLRSLLLLPLLGGLLFSFSGREQVEKGEFPVIQFQNQSTDGVTESMMEEYKAFMTEYKTKNRIDGSKLKRIIAIYRVMSEEQKATIEKYPEIPSLNLNSVVAKKPTKKQFDTWKNKNEFAIWIDGKHVDNTKLKSISKNEIYHYTSSFVYNNARSENFPQPYQNHLYTETGFNNTYRRPVGKTDTEFEKVVSEILIAKVKEKEKSLKNALEESINVVNARIKKPTLTVNGIVCDGCQLNLSKEGVSKIILGTTTGDNILEFRIKVPWNPTEVIKGNTLNANAIKYISKSELGTAITLFDIITVKREKLSNVVITLVDKNAKNYSHSPKVVKGEKSTLPPPPPPPTKAPEYVKGKKLTLNQIIEKTPKGVESGFEMLKNGESHYFTVHQGRKTYYNKDGYITNKDGKVLPPPPPPPPAPAPPKVKKGETSNIPTPPMPTSKKLKTLLPPAIPENATPEQRREMQAAIDHFEKKYKRKLYSAKNNTTGELISFIIDDEEYDVSTKNSKEENPWKIDMTVEEVAFDDVEKSTTKRTNECLSFSNVFNISQPKTTLNINCIKDYPENKLSIYNRWGKLIYSKKGYNNSWDGKVDNAFTNKENGKAQQGTYYYVLDTGENENKDALSGYLYIVD